MTHDRALQVSELTIHYGRRCAVDSVSFSAEHGEVVAVIGRNGAGKTSTMEACVGLRAPSHGSVQVLGSSIFHADETLRSRIGVMLQDGGIAPAARVRSLVRHYCNLYGRGVVADDLIAKVGLANRASSTWRQLSGGERQRFSLALALSGRPDIIFLDEPTAGVDFDGREAIRAIIGELVSAGCCVILATHDLDEAQRIADRVLLLHDGVVRLDGRMEDLCAGAARLEDVVRAATR